MRNITVCAANKIMRLILTGLSLSIMCFQLSAQGLTPDQLFAQKNYQGYITRCIDDFTGYSQTKSPMDVLLRVAIAYDKTNEWSNEAEMKIRQKNMGSIDMMNSLEGLKLLLKQDIRFMDKLSPNILFYPAAVNSIATTLREHDYQISADLISAFPSDSPGKRVSALVKIPKETRAQILTYTLSKQKDPRIPIALADAGIDLYMRPPANAGVDPKEYLNVAIEAGKDYVLNFDTVDKLKRIGKFNEAGELVKLIVEAKPDDVNIIINAARFTRSVESNAVAMTYYIKAMAKLPDPQRRDLRLDYLEFLLSVGKDDEILKMQSDKDPLAAGDAYLVKKKYPEATRQYASVAVNLTAPIERRLESWIALFDSVPDKALKNNNYFPQELAKADKSKRPFLTAWVGKELWMIVSREVPVKPGALNVTARNYCKTLNEVPEWEQQAAVIVDNLLKIDDIALLRNDNLHYSPSFRYPAAMMYSFSGESEKAAEILFRPIEMQYLPPQGGWKNADGSLANDAGRPRVTITPDENENLKMIAQVLEELSRCIKVEERVPALCSALADKIAANTENVTDNKLLSGNIMKLNIITKSAVAIFDPSILPKQMGQPATVIQNIDLKKLKPLNDAWQKMLENNSIANSYISQVTSCYIDILGNSKNPEVLTFFTDLSIMSLKRNVVVNKNTRNAENIQQSIIRTMTNRYDTNMKPYIEKMNQALK